MKYKDWLFEWLEKYIKLSNKIRTYERYRQIVSKHIIQNLGEFELNFISPSILQGFVAKLLQNGNLRTNQGLLANSVNSIISVLQSLLKTANMLCYTKNYVADKIIRPKITEKQVECFSLSEQKRLKHIVCKAKRKNYMALLYVFTLVYGLANSWHSNSQTLILINNLCIYQKLVMIVPMAEL